MVMPFWPRATEPGHWRPHHLASRGRGTPALTATGTAYCWGLTEFGRLDGGWEDASASTRIAADVDHVAGIVTSAAL